MKIVCLSSAVAVQNQTRDCCELGPHQLRHFFQKRFSKASRGADPNGQVHSVLGQLDKSSQHSASAGEHNARASLALVSGVSDLLSNQMDDFLGPGLNDVTQKSLSDCAWMARTHSGHLKHLIAFQHR